MVGIIQRMFVQWRMAIQSKLSRRIAPAAVALACIGLTGCSHVPGVYTYAPAGEKSSMGAGAAGPFDAKKYVAGIWPDKVLPTVQKDAVPATELLPALAADQNAASEKYGNQAGTGSPYAFLIKGTGTVTGLDAEAPTHPLKVRVDGLTGKDDTIQIVTGPVIAGTALRDGVKFIKFGDFTNQLDYADAASELNTKAKADVLAKVNATELVGKKVSFAGAFSLIAPGVVLVVPTELAPAS